MDDAATAKHFLNLPSLPRFAPGSLLAPDKSRSIIRFLGLLVVLAAVLVTSGSFLLLSKTTGFEPTPETWTITVSYTHLTLPTIYSV